MHAKPTHSRQPQTLIYYLVSKLHFLVQSIELELEPVPMAWQLGAAPPRQLEIVVPFLNPGIIAAVDLLLPREPLWQALQGRWNVDHHPMDPRHNRVFGIGGVDVLNHEGQSLGSIWKVVPLQGRRYVLLGTLAFGCVLSW